MKSISIKQATIHDFRDLTNLSEEFWKEHWQGEKHSSFDWEYCHDNFKAYSVGIQANVLVAWEENEMLGYSVAFLTPLHWTKQLRCTISYNYIKPEHRKRGIMDRFIEVHESWAVANKCIDMNLGDGAQHKGKFSLVAHALGFDLIGNDCYKVLEYEKED